MHVKNGLLKLIEVHRLTSKDMHSENCRWNLFEPSGQAQSLLFRHQGLATFPGQMRWFTRFEVSSRLQRLFTRKSLKEKTGTATLDEEGVKQRLQSAKRVARGWGAIANLKRKSICYHIPSSMHDLLVAAPLFVVNVLSSFNSPAVFLVLLQSVVR